MLESHLENRIKDAVYQKLPGPSVFLLSPESPIIRMFTPGNQVHSKRGFHLLFLLGGLGCKGGSLLLELSLWCVKHPIISGSSWLSSIAR